MVPNMYNVVVEIANRYPQEFREAHTGGPRTELWIKLLAYELSKSDPKWGLNGKRGTDTLSQDAINYKGEGPGHDPSDGNRPITVVDVIGGAGGPDPKPTWQVFSDLPGPGKWIKAEPVPGYHKPEGPVEPPPPPSPDPTVINAIQQLESQVKLILQVVEALKGERQQTAKLLQDANARLAEVRQALDANATEQVNSANRIKDSVDGLSGRLDRGFKFTAKGGFAVGTVNGELNLKG